MRQPQGHQPRSGALGKALAAIAEILWWWLAAVGVWALSLSSVPAPEAAIAAACGLPCAVAARAGRKAVAGRWRPRPRWIGWLAPLSVAIPADLGRLFMVVVTAGVTRRLPGGLRLIRMPAGEPPDVAAGRHAAAVFAISSTPGTFVADSKPEEGKLVIHTLASGWPNMEQVVRR